MTLESPAYYPYRDTDGDRAAVERAYTWRLRWWVDEEGFVIREQCHGDGGPGFFFQKKSAKCLPKNVP